jgi:TolB-like protein/Flp pilus assembly protein TadD
MTTAPDIFLSYNREDQARAKLFAEGFEAQGFKVWWDVGLRTGEAYDEVTETALRTAKAVVVLWSKKSVQSRWVRAEATLADRNKTLVPCMIEPCERPIMFELTQTAELGHWQGEKSDAVWLGFLGDVARFVGRERAPAPAALPPAPAIATAQPSVRSTRPSIAILPFTNRSTERADEVFAGGMGEDIAAALSLGRGLKVISQSATFAYRKNTSDLRTIGQEIGAKYILEGNTRRVGQSLRVTAQLVEAKTGAILWTQKFDRPLSELAELQEELVEELAAHLGAQIQKVEMERALKKPGDITAWEAMMRSWAALLRMSPDSLALAVTEARRAVALAPDYAMAHATLGMALATTFQEAGFRDRDLATETIVHAEAALKLSPDSPTVLHQAGISMVAAGRFSDGLELASRAVELNPNLGDARNNIGSVLNHFGRYEDALAQFAEAQRRAPRALSQYFMLGNRSWSLYGLNRLEEALEAACAAHRLSPSWRYMLASVPAFFQALSRSEEAQEAIRKARRAAPGEGLDYWLGLARGSHMAPAMFQSFSQHFTDAWNATPEEANP